MIIEKIIKQLLFSLLCFMLICVPIVMVKYAVSYSEMFSFLELPFLLLGFLFTIVFIRFFNFKRYTEKNIIAFSFIVANVGMIVSLLSFDTQPCSDYLSIYNSAVEMGKGNFCIHNYDTCSYMYIYNWQLGISAFESIMFQLFGTNMTCLQVLNLLLINVTLFLTYKLAHVMTDDKSACYALLLMALFYPILITVNQFTNQHIVLPFILAVLLCLRSSRISMWLLGGLLTAIFNFLRPEGILIIITSILYAGCLILRIWKIKKELFLTALRLLLFLLAFFSLQKTLDTIMINEEYADSPVTQAKLPYFKFHKGLTGYNCPEPEKFDCNLEQFNEWERRQVRDAIIKTPVATASFVVTKMIRYLGEFDWKYENTYNHDSKICNSYPVKAFVMFGWAQYIIAILLAIIGYRQWYKSSPIEASEIFYIGVVTVYIFIEAFSSYRYESYPILLIFSGIGLSICLNKYNIHSKTNKRNV